MQTIQYHLSCTHLGSPEYDTEVHDVYSIRFQQVEAINVLQTERSVESGFPPCAISISDHLALLSGRTWTFATGDIPILAAHRMS